MNLRRQGFAVWFTGLPSSGKSTLAGMLRDRLEALEYPAVLLDGDEVRTRLTKGLGFSRADRDENISRIAYVARLLTEVGAVAITAAISPYREARDKARTEIGDFVEVYLDCPLEECIRRDVKGLYARAVRGEIPHFTGISDPYEPPLAPEIIVKTDVETPEQCLEEILETLARLGYLPDGGLPPGSRSSLRGRASPSGKGIHERDHQKAEFHRDRHPKGRDILNPCLPL